MPRRSPPSRHYLFYVEDTLPQPEAHLVTVTQQANAAANLGYSAVLVYPQGGPRAWQPWRWLWPFVPQAPARSIVQLYGLQDKLQVIPLAMPWPIGVWRSKWTAINTWACKYYFPVHLLRRSALVQTNNWNLVKVAVKQGTPVIFEQEHYGQRAFEADIVHSPYFLAAVTLSDPIHQDLIQRGMPPEKILQVHLGFNQNFRQRQQSAAAQWRREILGQASPGSNQERLKGPETARAIVVYAGALARFKGIDLVLEIAPHLPQVTFVFAGGTPAQVQHYQALAQAQGASNTQFLGHVGHDRLVSLLQAANIVIYPHLSGEAATFTSPLKFFEYLASGTPLVCTTIPPLQPFQAESLAIHWSEPDSASQLHQALAQALAAYPYRPEGYPSNAAFVDQFSWDNRIRQILAFAQARASQQGLTLAIPFTQPEIPPNHA